jgi:hypothetical protein
MPICFNQNAKDNQIFLPSKIQRKKRSECCCGQQLTQKLGITLKALELKLITQQLTQKLGLTLEASKLESITLKERKLEVILILEEQIQLVLTRVRDKVLRSSMYTAKILLETPMLRYYWKFQCWLRYYWKLQC